MTDRQGDPILVLRILVGSLAAGVLLVVAAAFVARGRIALPDRGDLEPALLAVLVPFALGSSAVLVLLDRAFAARVARRRLELLRTHDPATAVLPEYRQLTILKAAIVEAPAFFAAMVHLLTGSEIALGLGALGAAVLIAFCMPSRDRLERFARQALEAQGS